MTVTLPPPRDPVRESRIITACLDASRHPSPGVPERDAIIAAIRSGSTWIRLGRIAGMPAKALSDVIQGGAGRQRTMRGRRISTHGDTLLRIARALGITLDTLVLALDTIRGLNGAVPPPKVERGSIPLSDEDLRRFWGDE